MPGFDWNGNGKSDAFDHFMDMKVISDVYGNDDGSDIDTDDFETDSCDANDDQDNLDLYRTQLIGTLKTASTQNNRGNQGTAMNFQDELKKNLRSPEVVKKETEEKKTNRALETAKYDLSKIKSKLIENAKAAKYTVVNGVTTVTCIYEDYWQINRYMRTGRLDNGNEIAENQKKFALLRDPNLVYCVWKTFQIEPKYSTEYYQYAAALKQVAAEENIQIEFVVHNNKTDEIYPFPSKIKDTYNMTYCQLCVRASTVISGSPSSSSPQVKHHVEPPKTEQPAKTYSETQTQQPSSNSKRSDGEVLLRSILVIALCVIAFVLCLSGGIGKLGMGLLLIGAAIGGYFILK